MLRDIQETALINIEVEEQTMNIGIIGATGKLGTKVLDEAQPVSYTHLTLPTILLV